MQARWEDPPPGGPRGPTTGTQFAMPRLTPMVKRLLIANGIVFGAILLTYLVSTQAIGPVFRLFGITPALWIDWFPLAPLWQIVTWGFFHRIKDPWHIVGNMLFLYFLGTMLEGLVGGRRFLAVYFSALLISGIATLAIGLIGNQDIPTIGASGAVLCVVVAMAVLRPQTRIIFLLFPITLRTLAILYVSVDVFFLLMSLKGADTNVAHLAHLSGAAWGFLIARQGWIWRDPVQDVSDWKDARRERREEDDVVRLDEILAKINREGIGSLTSSEKAVLKRSSKRR